MNNDNIQKVIDAIKFNEHSHFNMSTYIGIVEHNNHDNVHSLKTASLHIDETDIGKDIFDCKTTACIAGFATALSCNWIVDEKLSNINGTWYEKISNEYLGLTVDEGNNLYYAEHSSVWKMLKYNHPDFSDLRIDMDNFWNGDYDEYDEYDAGDQFEDDEDAPIDLNSISPEMAIKALEMVMSGEILLANEDGKAELQAMRKV